MYDSVEFYLDLRLYLVVHFILYDFDVYHKYKNIFCILLFHEFYVFEK